MARNGLLAGGRKKGADCVRVLFWKSYLISNFFSTSVNLKIRVRLSPFYI
jgi:hypothetical protein